MKKLLTIALALMLVTSVFAQPRMGQKQPRMDNDRPMMTRNTLDLSDAQMSQLQELRADQQKSMIPLTADLKVKRIELKELIADGKSTKLIDSKQKSILLTQSKIANLRTNHLIKIRKVVGEDNFKKMGAMKNRRGNKGSNRNSMRHRR
ncbi:MAG: periplasmic heavy metal sensor [Candidatus Marinimicrobia bacterium]|nr:periplasmic heavy metal sensor [Candidatus Neomarinimicrobiota bacterium]